MDMTGEFRIPAPRETVWAALNDPEVLKACIPGCEELVRDGDALAAKVRAKVGPVSARFAGKVTLSDMDPPNGYRISGEGQGGAAGFAKGGASVSLTDDGAGTVLRYTAQATVGGKLAQIGSRLIDSTARKMADEFFGKFAQLVGAPAAAAPIMEEPAMKEPTPVPHPTAPTAADDPRPANMPPVGSSPQRESVELGNEANQPEPLAVTGSGLGGAAAVEPSLIEPGVYEGPPDPPVDPRSMHPTPVGPRVPLHADAPGGNPELNIIPSASEPGNQPSATKPPPPPPAPAPTADTAPASGGGIPMAVWVAGLVVVILLLIFVFR